MSGIWPRRNTSFSRRHKIEGADRADRMKTLLKNMLGYVSVSTCRQLAILEYFSDEARTGLGPLRPLRSLCRAGAAAEQGGSRIDDIASAKAILKPCSGAWAGSA